MAGARPLLAQRDEPYYEVLYLNWKNAFDAEVKARTAAKLSLYLVSIDPALALSYAREAFENSQSIDDETLKAGALLALGKAEIEQAQRNSGIQKLKQALALAQTLHNVWLEAETLNALARIKLIENRKAAYADVMKALQLSERHQLGLCQAESYLILGDWLRLDNPQDALGQYQKAFEIYQKENQTEAQINTLQKMAETQLTYREDGRAALQNWQQAIKLAESTNHPRLLAHSLNGQALLNASALMQYKAALQSYFQAYVIAQEYDFLLRGASLATSLKGIASCYAALARQARQKGNEEEKREYEQKFKTYQQLFVDLENLNGNVALFKQKQKAENQRRYQTASPIVSLPANENRLREIKNEKNAIENQARKNEISVLEASRQKAILLKEEDSLFLSLTNKDELISRLQREQSEKDAQIEVLSRDAQQKELEINQTYQQRNYWLLGIFLLVLGSGLYLAYHQKRFRRQLAVQKSSFNQQKERINRQEVLVREQATLIERKEEELVYALAKLDDAKLDNRLMAEMMKQEMVPLLSAYIDKKNVPSENTYLAQEGQKLVYLLQSMYALQNQVGPLVMLAADYSLFKIARKAWEQCNSLFKEKNMLFVNQIRPFYYAFGEEARLMEVFLFLYYNSLHYAPAGGFVQLEADQIYQGGKKFIKITYTDPGPAIAADLQSLAFEKFSPEEARPLALTMPYLRRVIEQHGGQIALQTNREEGFQVIFTLPEAQEVFV
ncbi:MAG: hypothetical protein HC913_03325 [Microscillaceae bacterium]|nr:hypothetical protein [Microscillaceae bacterium]